MNQRSIAVWLGLAAAMLIAACPALSPAEPVPPSNAQSQPSDPSPDSPLSAPQSPLLAPVAVSEVVEGVTGEAPQALLNLILDDASERTGLDRRALQIVQDQAVIWPDGSLGCAQPGVIYTQALVDGYHVIVTAGDQRLDYRAGGSNSFRLCENPKPDAPGGTPLR